MTPSAEKAVRKSTETDRNGADFLHAKFPSIIKGNHRHNILSPSIINNFEFYLSRKILFCSNIGDECPCHVSLQIQSDCILADKFCAHFLSFFLFLSLEIFYSSMPLLQRCIADSVCVSVTFFFLHTYNGNEGGIGSCFSNTVHSGEFLRPIY